MTRFKLIPFGIAAALFLHSCSEILEPVSLFSGKPDVEIESVQENFEINIKSLTFESARDANNAPYPRRLMQTGIGSSANVVDEADFLISNMPPPLKSTDYLLGIGDRLSFARLKAFVVTTTQFPSDNLVGDYLLGVGDELTLVQLNEIESGLSTIITSITNTGDDEKNGNGGTPQPRESILKTSGIVGTDGNILLLGLGSIKAENRSLSDIQTEVRNILIRNGLAPSFQLEITGFNSKKAFVTFPNPDKILGNNVRTKFWRIECHNIDYLQIDSDFNYCNRNGQVIRVRNKFGTRLLKTLTTINLDRLLWSVILRGVPHFRNQIPIGYTFDVKDEVAYDWRWHRIITRLRDQKVSSYPTGDSLKTKATH